MVANAACPQRWRMASGLSPRTAIHVAALARKSCQVIARLAAVVTCSSWRSTPATFSQRRNVRDRCVASKSNTVPFPPVFSCIAWSSGSKVGSTLNRRAMPVFVDLSAPVSRSRARAIRRMPCSRSTSRQSSLATSPSRPYE
ncbi:MAG TPA: hypothetical protein VE987_10075 [Polyangiaceae bacterium]|nr:hypothetical protein [Polyangiaceae bacterium]